VGTGIETFLDWVYDVEKFFDMTYTLEKNHVKFIAYKLKGATTAWWINCRSRGDAKPSHS